jgi:hypothetical protein
MHDALKTYGGVDVYRPTCSWPCRPPGLELGPVGHPARSQSLCRLRYPGSFITSKTILIYIRSLHIKQRCFPKYAKLPPLACIGNNFRLRNCQARTKSTAAVRVHGSVGGWGGHSSRMPMHSPRGLPMSALDAWLALNRLLGRYIHRAAHSEPAGYGPYPHYVSALAPFIIDE